MIETLHAALRGIHIGSGVLGMILFWAAALSRKGGRIHRQTGKLFVALTYLVVFTAFISCCWNLIDPYSFTGRAELTEGNRRALRFFALLLLGLAMFTCSAAAFGIRCARSRLNNGVILDTGLRLVLLTLAACGLCLTTIGMIDALSADRYPRSWALVGLGFLSLLFAKSDYIFAKTPPDDPKEILRKHIGSMIGCGIAYHTAFLITGADRFLDGYLTGYAQLIPWILPTLIGLPVAAWVTRKHTSSDRRTISAVERS